MTRTRHRNVSALFGVALAMVAFTWAIASPLGSSPDDNFHLNSIWCAWDREGSGCEVVGPDEDPRQQLVDVPALQSAMPWCYAFKPTQSAACQSDPAVVIPADQIRSPANVSLYPKGYYALMRALVGDDAQRSIIMMRLVTAGTSALMLWAAAMLFARPERWRVGLFTLVATVPLGLFVFASVNPSAWTIAATGGTFLATVAACRSTDRRAALLSGAAAAGYVLLAASARADAALFCGIAVLVAGAASFPFNARWRSHAVALISPLVAIVVAYAASARSVPDPEGGSLPGGTWQLLSVPALYLGPGAQQLSFRDVTMPAASWVAVTLAVGMTLALGWRRLDSRRTMALAVALVALAGVPLYWQWLQGGSNPLGYVQPRYVLPAALTAVLLLAVNLPNDRLRVRRDSLMIIAGLLAVANFTALFKVLRRFTTGSDVIGWDLSTGREWWWSWAPPPQFVWWLGGVAFAVAVAIMAVRGADPAERTDQVDSTGSSARSN